jgi:hypothetical protein
MVLIIAMLATIETGCLDNPRDNPYDNWIKSGDFVTPPAEDTVPPAPGDDSALAVTIVNPTAVSLSWTKANDAVTLQENLEYKVVYSGSDDITTPDDIDDHGTIIQDWTKDLEDKPVSSLTKGNTYYFNVAVRDAKGNRAAYQRAKVDPLGVVYLFSTGTKHNGNLEGRTGANAKCQACYDANYTSLSCTSVRAFVSFNGGDEMRYMPENHGVPDNLVIHGPTGIRIGINWDDLFDSSIEKSMAEANVESSHNYWTGAASNGGATSMNCSGWTVGVDWIGINWQAGEGGNQASTSSTWINNAFFAGCAETRPILCVCW